MAFLSLFKSKKEELGLIINIDNGGVSVSVASFGEKPKFLHAEDGVFSASSKLSADKLIQNVLATLDKLLSEVVKKGFQVSGVMVVFSSPWFIFKSKKISLSKEEAFVISENFLKEVLSKEEKILRSEILKSLSIKNDDEFEFIEKSIVHTKINGYDLDNSIGNKTKNFDAYLCMSALGKDMKNKILDMIIKHTHILPQKIGMHTFPLVTYSALRDVFHKEQNFLLVHITSEIIDIAFIKDGVIFEAVSLPSGRNFLLRQIAKAFNTSVEIAESTLHLYIAEKADSETTLAIQDIIIKLEKEWTAYFENASREVLEGSPPPRAYVISKDDICNLHINFLKMGDDNITYLNHAFIDHFYIQNPSIAPTKIAIMSALFYEKTKK